MAAAVLSYTAKPSWHRCGNTCIQAPRHLGRDTQATGIAWPSTLGICPNEGLTIVSTTYLPPGWLLYSRDFALKTFEAAHNLMQ